MGDGLWHCYTNISSIGTVKRGIHQAEIRKFESNHLISFNHTIPMPKDWAILSEDELFRTRKSMFWGIPALGNSNLGYLTHNASRKAGYSYGIGTGVIWNLPSHS